MKYKSFHYNKLKFLLSSTKAFLCNYILLALFEKATIGNFFNSPALFCRLNWLKEKDSTPLGEISNAE